MEELSLLYMNPSIFEPLFDFLVLWFHFRGMRSGTVPHVLAVGLGAACEVAKDELEVN